MEKCISYGIQFCVGCGLVPSGITAALPTARRARERAMASKILACSASRGLQAGRARVLLGRAHAGRDRQPSSAPSHPSIPIGNALRQSRSAFATTAPTARPVALDFAASPAPAALAGTRRRCARSTRAGRERGMENAGLDVVSMSRACSPNRVGCAMPARIRCRCRAGNDPAQRSHARIGR
jgi:hypothetical protein